MKAKITSGIIRGALVSGLLALAGAALPELRTLDVPLLMAAMVLLVAVFVNIGLPMTHGLSTFLPMVALTSYLILGFSRGLWVLVPGLIIGGIVTFIRRSNEHDPQSITWVLVIDSAWPLALHGLSLGAAHFAYVGLEGELPLRRVPEMPALLPIVAAAVFYLLAYNALLALDAWLAGHSVLGFFKDNRRVLLAAQVLPLPLAPINAVALVALGPSVYYVSIATLFTIAITVNQLTLAQSRLRKQVRQLSSFSSMSRAVRGSLELSELLDNIFQQVSEVLGTQNFYIVLADADRDQYSYPFVVREGRREARPSRGRRNNFEDWVIDQQQPLLVASDVEGTARHMAISPPEADLLSWIGVPLQVPERTIGCMAVYAVHQSDRTFDDEDLEILSNVAGQASVAVENALLYENARQHSDQLVTINEISAAINASLDPEKVLDMVSRSITDVAGCNKAAIYLLDEETQQLDLSYSEGFSDGYHALSKTLTVPLTHDERDAVMETGDVVAVPDIQSTDDVSPGMIALAENENFLSYANFPLRAHGQTIGLLSVYYDTTHRFQESELELLQTFANQAALAVANARRYTVTDQALGRRVDQIVAISDINRKLSATLDLDRVFHLVNDAALEACDATASMLIINNEENGTYRVASWRGYPPDIIQRLERGKQVAAQGISARVLKSGQTALIDDVRSDPDYVNMSVGTRSQLSVPVVLDEKVIGVITLESDAEEAFSENDVDFVSQLSNQAGIAIKNAQLYRRLNEVNDRMHAILDSSSDGLLMIDTRGRIVMTNTRMEAFWDFARQDFQERTVDEFVADPLSVLGEGLGYIEGEISGLITRATRDPDMDGQHDLYVTGGDGPQRFVERTASPVRDEFGNLIGLLMLLRDVTEQKELEEAREDLANMLIHDLRNPLTAVLASMALVRNVVVAKDETGIAKQATEVSSRAVRKLLVMINNLLDLSRIEAGEFSPDRKRTSLASVVGNAVGELLPLAIEMEVTVEVENDTLENMPDVSIDPDMIERVIINLLDNSLKFSPTGGHVRVLAELQHSKADEKGEDTTKKEQNEMVQLSIVDSGPGVPDDYKKRIFQRYEQVRGQKGRRRGTGLGLAFCRIAVDSHGGEIWVSDAPETGSSFNLTLPVAEDGPAVKEQSAEETEDQAEES